MDSLKITQGLASVDKHSNNFDLMRLLLAVLVILSHSHIMIDGKDSSDPLAAVFHGVTMGELAVDGFFLLSGFLILQSWDNGPHPLTFLKKRILRIYPGFIVSALICTLIVGPLGADVSRYFSQLEITKLLKSIVMLRVPAVPPTFIGLPFPTVNGSMWTIFFEFVCYLSVLVLGTIGVIKLRYSWLVITVIIVSVGVFQKWTLSLSDHDFVLPLLRLSTFFFVGGCFYRYKDYIPFTPTLVVVSGVFFIVGISHKEIPELLLAVSCGYLLFHIAAWQAPVLTRFRKMPDFSYGVYLYGWPVQKLLLWYVPTITPRLLFTVAIIISLTLGMLSWYIIEKPFMKLKSVGWRRGIFQPT